MVLVIDNYDSFVHNLARYVRELGFKTQVVRNDAITLEDIHASLPSHIILSPGPCTPNEAGICLDLIRTFGTQVPILGVCLGHQAIGQAYGGQVDRAKCPMHGKSSLIHHQAEGLFEGCEHPFKVARYHSLIVKTEGLPDCLEITATSDEGEIMALQHRHHPVYGVQFHPESVLTPHGYDVLEKFLSIQV